MLRFANEQEISPSLVRPMCVHAKERIFLMAKRTARAVSNGISVKSFVFNKKK